MPYGSYQKTVSVTKTEFHGRILTITYSGDPIGTQSGRIQTIETYVDALNDVGKYRFPLLAFSLNFSRRVFYDVIRERKEGGYDGAQI